MIFEFFGLFWVFVFFRVFTCCFSNLTKKSCSEQFVASLGWVQIKISMIRSPKSTKNGLEAEKVRPETAPEAIFVVFSCRCRSQSLSGPIFGRSDPPKLCSHHSGSTILTKSPFSKKHRKSSLRGPVLGAKTAKSRRRGDPKSRKSGKK